MVTVKEQKEKDKSRRESLTDVPVSAFITLFAMGIVTTIVFAMTANRTLKK